MLHHNYLIISYYYIVMLLYLHTKHHILTVAMPACQYNYGVKTEN